MELEPSNEFMQNCSIHLISQTNYCISCSKFICSECLGDHFQHKLIFSKNIMDFLMKEVESDYLKKCIDILGTMKKNILTALDNLLEETTKKFHESMKNDMKNELSDIHFQALDSVRKNPNFM